MRRVNPFASARITRFTGPGLERRLQPASITMQHQLHAYDYVNHPYTTVRDALLGDSLATFQRATTVAASRAEAIGAELRAHLGSLIVSATIQIELVRTESAIGPGGVPATNFVLRWRAAERAALFPSMNAVLSVYALTPTETQLDLSGIYAPPLGALGEALDSIALHHIAKESVAGFIQSVAKFLRQELTTRANANVAGDQGV